VLRVSDLDVHFKCLYMERLLYRQEVEDIEVRLRHGGLGGVPDFERWTKKLAAATTVQDFVSTWKHFKACLEK